jgi:diguanylate cyclase (GGDEF)-like protein
MSPGRKTPPLPPPVRVFQTTSEIDKAITKMRRRIQDVERLTAEHVSRRDAAVDNVEHAIIDTIRETFGEGSSQYDRHRYFAIDDGPQRLMGMRENPAHFHAQRQAQFEQHIPHAIKRLEGLIQQLDEKRADLSESDAMSPTVDPALDPLVGLPDRAGLKREFDERTAEPNVPLSLVLWDIDEFKSVNDGPGGHPAGDEALVSLANVARNCVRGKGSAFRFGGDEFALLLPNHSVEEGLAVAERFRREVEGSPRTSQNLRLTVSVGVAEWPANGNNFDSLYRAADSALYDAKNRGRNLVRYCGEPEPATIAPREPERRQPEPGGLSADEQRTIREEYFRTRVARCPRDQALLDVQDVTTFGQSRNSLLVSCPLCGLSAGVD